MNFVDQGTESHNFVELGKFVSAEGSWFKKSKTIFHESDGFAGFLTDYMERCAKLWCVVGIADIRLIGDF